jgi:hypothetical protein
LVKHCAIALTLSANFTHSSRVCSGVGQEIIMKSVMSAVVSATLLLVMGAASAQETTSDHVSHAVKALAQKNETLVGAVQIAEIGEDEISDFTFQIDPGKTYYIRGACDDDCSDIDLEAFNAAGASVGEDTSPNELPQIQIPAGKSGAEIHINVTMVTCNAEICVTGVGLFQSKP